MPSAGQYIAVGRFQPANLGLEAEFILAALAARATVALPQRWVGQQPSQGIGEVTRAVRRDQQASLLVLDHLRNTRDGRPNHRQAIRHRLHDRQGQRIRIGGQYHDVGSCQPAADVCLKAGETRFAIQFPVLPPHLIAVGFASLRRITQQHQLSPLPQNCGEQRPKPEAGPPRLSAR